MRTTIFLTIAITGMCGCSALPTTNTPTGEPMTTTPSAEDTCRTAGSSDDQINGLRTLVENARNAGAVAADVLSDANTSCEVCLDPNVDCDVTLCESCFTAIVNEAFAQ